jgi:hypothetical protein
LSPTLRRRQSLLILLITVAAAFRIAAWVVLPVAHDEVNVIA